MSSELTMLPNLFGVHATYESEGVILNGAPDIDYRVVRFQAVSDDLFQGALCVCTGDKKVALAGDNANVNAIVLNSPNNKRILEDQADDPQDWDSTFDTNAWVEVALILRGVVARVKFQASAGAVDLNTAIQCGGSGLAKVQATGGRPIGFALCKVSNGTGAQVGPAFLHGVRTQTVTA